MARILVIEDERNARENILELLKLEGYETLGARNGNEGFFLANTEPVDLVICDILLPGIDGFEVLKRLRSDPRSVALPFIFLTAKSQRESQREGMNLGAEDYIAKPYTRTELLNSVRTRLERKKALDDAMQRNLSVLEQQDIYQLPLDFSDPLMIILNASDMLAHPDHSQTPMDSRELGYIIHDTSLMLMDSVQKYLFLADLESRATMPVGICPQTGEMTSLILKEKAGRQYSIQSEVDSFSCAISEEDLFKWMEYICDLAVLLADPNFPIKLRAESLPTKKKARIIIECTIPDSMKLYEMDGGKGNSPQTFYHRQQNILQRMAVRLGVLLNISVDSSNKVQFFILLPLTAAPPTQ